MELSVVLLLTCLATSYSLPGINEDGRPVVTVQQGTMVGLQESHPEIDMFAFRSIPYAEPPVDELRFMAPVPAGPWEGELNATDIPPMCMQFKILGEEDCLYLNVYTPTETNETGLLPVMVFIYGGAYYLGDTRFYDRPNRLVQNDVIVAMMNYRVGVLGFFSTGDSVAPGNQGFMDQTLALQWIQDNIEFFGGDPGRVTIFGESAGSASVHYQILAPSARGLFQQAIMESGTSLSPWARGREYARVSREIAEMLGCNENGTSEEIVICLQGKLAFRVSNTYGDFIEFNLQPFYFAPRVDGTFIPDEPGVLLKEGRFAQIPIIIGTNREDGSLFSGEMYARPSIIDSFNANFNETGPITLELYDDEDPINTATAAYEYYLGSTFIAEEDAEELTIMYTDRFFAHPTDWVAIYHAQVAPVYMYQLNHRAVFSLATFYNLAGVEEAQDWVCHADDLQYLFDFVNRTEPASEDDLLIGDMFTQTWTDFVKTGNPTPTTDALGILWDPVEEENLQHLAIELSPAMAEDARATAREFWLSLPLRISDILNAP